MLNRSCKEVLTDHALLFGGGGNKKNYWSPGQVHSGQLVPHQRVNSPPPPTSFPREAEEITNCVRCRDSLVTLRDEFPPFSILNIHTPHLLALMCHEFGEGMCGTFLASSSSYWITFIITYPTDFFIFFLNKFVNAQPSFPFQK